MNEIILTVFKNPKEWILKNVPDMTSDRFCCVRPISKLTEKGASYEDIEENIKKFCSMEDHIIALQLLVEKVGRTLFVGCVENPMDLIDPCNWDIEVTDAYWQLVFYKDVIYG